jgi:uncharacterized phage protein gp47/JayE
MPFLIPDLPALVQRTANAFRVNLKGSDAKLWPNNVSVAAKVIAGAIWEPFAFLDYIRQQIFVSTADGPFLERHALEYGMARLPATFAQGSIVLTGDPNVAVPAGLVCRRADGVLYDVTSSGTTDGSGNITLQVRAQVAGKGGNAAPGVAVTLTALVDRMNVVGAVASAGIGLGADIESYESLRQRVLFRKRMPPHGGAAHDYIAWAREVNGVTRVFVDPVTATNNRTSVGVWFLMDDTYENGIPLDSDVAAVATYIDVLRPAGAIVSVAKPEAVPIDITLSVSPDTTAVRNAVIAELRDLFRRQARVSTLTEPYTLYRSKLIEAISIATGEDHDNLTAPAGDVAIDAGSIPVLGEVTFA